MRKLHMALIALSVAAVGALAAFSGAEANQAANQSRIPGLQTMVPSDVHSADWVIYVKWYNGCNRQRWCKSRRWDGYKYVYYDCYWGNCYYSGGRSY
jgi:hypothetical protein